MATKEVQPTNEIKPRNYQKNHGIINLERMTPATQERVEDIASKIAKGASRESVIDWLKTDEHYSRRRAVELYECAIAYLCPQDSETYRKGLIQANIGRLERIIEDNIKSRPNIALGAISEINKVLLGGQKIIVEENREGDHRITIAFGE